MTIYKLLTIVYRGGIILVRLSKGGVMAIRTKSQTLQIIKDIFHAVMPIVILFALPKGIIALVLSTVYVLIKGYVYFELRDPDKESSVAILGTILNLMLLSFYIEAF